MKNILGNVTTKLSRNDWWKSKKNDFIVFVVMYFFFIILINVFYDTKSATYEDYKPLYDKAKILSEDFGNITKMNDVELELENGKISAILLSKECNLKVTFNDSLSEIVNYEECDKSTTMLFILFESFFDALLLTLFIVVAMRAATSDAFKKS